MQHGTVAKALPEAVRRLEGVKTTSQDNLLGHEAEAGDTKKNSGRFNLTSKGKKEAISHSAGIVTVQCHTRT